MEKFKGSLLLIENQTFRCVIVLIGINDIGRSMRAKDPTDPVSVADLAWGLDQIAERAHENGIKVVAATLTPAGHGSSTGEALRSGLNDWIRSSKAFDGVIDFDAVVRIPNTPRECCPRMTPAIRFTPAMKVTRKWGIRSI